MVAAADSSPALTPAAAAALLGEADAALGRMRRVVPPMWHTSALTEQRMAAPMQPSIGANAALSPHAWQAAIRGERLGKERAAMERVVARTAAAATCDACGLPSPMLKRCSGCGAARYCSRECQKRAWPAHKASCVKGKERADAGQPGGGAASGPKHGPAFPPASVHGPK